MPGSATEPASRYRVIRPVGAGGMGVVDLVYDAVRDEQVARKRILDATPEALLRFKREFRAIEGLRHPGLVALYELGEDERGVYFTMQYIDGEPLLAYCVARSGMRWAEARTESAHAGSEAVVDARWAAPTQTAEPPSRGGIAPVSRPPASRPAQSVPLAPRCDWERVNEVVRQIMDALSALHAQGIVHCDLKPSNVLVTPEGLVKLLDFGVIAELRAPGALQRDAASGTVDYMAPERLRGEPATPAVDAYALGVLVFEVISGTRPFRGGVGEIVRGHLNAEPPRLETAVLGAPKPWADLCAALLRKSPGDRATLADVRAVVRPEERALPPAEAPRGLLLGRAALQGRLHERWRAVREGAFDYVLLTGPTGSGKTSLAEWLSNEARDTEALVLWGRARPSERIGFNVLDGAIDDLARVLRGESGSDEVRGDRAIAASAFPVLGVEASAPSASRSEAFGALFRILVHLAATRPVLVVLDDFQWADADSLALVDDLLELAPRRVMLAFTSRFDVEESRATTWVRAHAAQHEAPVTPLGDADIVRIIERAARSVAPPAAALGDLVESTAGLPALAEVAGRVAARGGDPGSLGSALAQIIASKGPLALHVLALVVASEEWLAIDGLAAMAGETPGAVEEAVVLLASDSIVRRSAERKVDVYHDTMRIAALGVLGEERLRQAHARIAVWLRADPAAPVFRVVHHLRAGGDVTEAARLARDAARVAEEQRAYGFAADMYALALTAAAPEERGALLRARARALERIGGYREAGACWREVRAAARDREESLDAAVHEAQCLLGAGEVALGYRRLDEAFIAAGRPSIRERSWVEAAEFLVGPLLGRAAKVRGPIDLARAERELAAATIVANFDPIAGGTMLMRARRAFLREGALEMVALCEMTCAIIAYCSVARGARVPLGDRWWRAAETRLPGGADVPKVDANRHLLEATVALRAGSWGAAERHCEDGIHALERAGYAGSHGHLFLLVGRCELELWRQDIVAFGAQHRRLREGVRDGGAGPVTFQVAATEVQLRALAGDLEKAAALSADLRAAWPKEPLTSQRVYMEMYATWVEVQRGDARAAWEASRRLHDVLGTISGTAMHDCLFHGVAARAELLAWGARIPGASAGRARRRAQRCEGAPPVFGGIGARTLAYLMEAEGHVEAAVAKLEACERAATALGQRLDLGIARWQRGRLLGGDEGARLQRTATEVMVAAGSSAALFGEWPPPGKLRA